MRLRPILATLIFALLLYGFWTQVVATGLAARLNGHLPSAFACFALLLAVLWFFGFRTNTAHNTTDSENVGTGFQARALFTSRVARILLPSLLALPYILFSIPRYEFHWI